METVLPFILQNAHRFFLYLAFIPLFFLWVDAAQSLRFEGQWRIGLGAFVLFFNAALLSATAVLLFAAPPIGGRMDASRALVARRSATACGSGSRRSTATTWHGRGRVSCP
jgi:hypothetical protein